MKRFEQFGAASSAWSRATAQQLQAGRGCSPVDPSPGAERRRRHAPLGHEDGRSQKLGGPLPRNLRGAVGCVSGRDAAGRQPLSQPPLFGGGRSASAGRPRCSVFAKTATGEGPLEGHGAPVSPSSSTPTHSPASGSGLQTAGCSSPSSYTEEPRPRRGRHGRQQ